MKVTVFGATGAIGSLVVDSLLASGHVVTAFARTPSRVPDTWAQNVKVVIGQLDDVAAIDAAVMGADAVISALGPSSDKNAVGMPVAEGTERIAASMQRQGVRRYVGLATPSVLDERDRPGLVIRLTRAIGKRAVGRAFSEFQLMTAAITGADLDWTIVRFLAPNDKTPTGDLKVGFFGGTKIGFSVTRGDIAAFMARQLDDLTYVKAMPAISN